MKQPIRPQPLLKKFGYTFLNGRFSGWCKAFRNLVGLHRGGFDVWPETHLPYWSRKSMQLRRVLGLKYMPDKLRK